LRKNKSVFRKFLCLIAVVFLCTVTGCASFTQKDVADTGKENLPVQQDDEVEDAVEVVTTIFPLADIVENLGGGRVKVTALLPPGASPHTYEPTVEQAKAVAKADLFIFVGGGLDNWVLDLAEAEGVSTLEVMEQMGEQILEYNPVQLDEAGEDGQGDTEAHEHEHAQESPADEPNHEDEEHNNHSREHHHGAYDPHVWMDPVLVKDLIAPLITEKLKEVDPERVNAFDNSLVKYQAELEELHQEILTAVGKFTKKQFISYHSAWNYFAHRYGLEEVASVEAFPGKEPSAQWLAQLVDLAKNYQIDVLFAEPQMSTETTEIIAEEIGGRVLVLDPLGGKGVSGRDSYIDLIRFNLEIFRQALE